MATSRSCSFPAIFNVQHAGGIAVFVWAIVFKSIYRIFTINYHTENGIVNPKCNFFWIILNII